MRQKIRRELKGKLISALINSNEIKSLSDLDGLVVFIFLLSSTKWWHMRLIRLFQSCAQPFNIKPVVLSHVRPSPNLCGRTRSTFLLLKHVGRPWSESSRYQWKKASFMPLISIWMFVFCAFFVCTALVKCSSCAPDEGIQSVFYACFFLLLLGLTL